MVLSEYTDGELGASYVSEDPRASSVPQIVQCLSYWDSLTKDGKLPCWGSFDWMKVPLDIIPYCGVVDVRTDPLDFIYRFWGTAHATAMKQELTGKSVKEMRPASECQSVFGQYKATYIAGKPQLFVNTIHWISEVRDMKEHSLRLPFSEDGESIDQILAFSDMRQDLEHLSTAFRKASYSPKPN